MYYNGSMATKIVTSIRITPAGKAIMERVSKQYGISQGAVIEIAVRALAKSEAATPIRIEDAEEESN